MIHEGACIISKSSYFHVGRKKNKQKKNRYNYKEVFSISLLDVCPNYTTLLSLRCHPRDRAVLRTKKAISVFSINQKLSRDL